MIELKPCPCCGSRDVKFIDIGVYTCYAQCNECGLRTAPIKASIDYSAREIAARNWNRRAGHIELNIYDQEEIHHNCTVQILTNSRTGEQSIGWWHEDEPPVGFTEADE